MTKNDKKRRVTVSGRKAAGGSDAMLRVQLAKAESEAESVWSRSKIKRASWAGKEYNSRRGRSRGKILAARGDRCTG
jgi:hypothetical protein